MPRYLLKRPAFIGGVYYEKDSVITLEGGKQPSSAVIAPEEPISSEVVPDEQIELFTQDDPLAPPLDLKLEEKKK